MSNPVDAQVLSLQEGGVELLLATLRWAPAVDGIKTQSIGHHSGAGIAEKFGEKLIQLVGNKHVRGSVLFTLEALVVLGGRNFVSYWGEPIVAAVQSMLPQVHSC